MDTSVGGYCLKRNPISFFWLTELPFPSVVDSSSTCSRLMSTLVVDGPLQLFVHSFEWLVSSKAVFGGGVSPSCVGKRKWILRWEGVA